MVNFFIGRPIFATVLALLMVLIGGICIFVLPISLYPDIVPPQVQITATYTGADAQTVADSVTTPIEQKVNGVNGMIYMSSDSTSNGLSRILVTLDVGYSQDIGAIDVQNKVDTAKPTLAARGDPGRRREQEDDHQHGLRGQPGQPQGDVRLELPRQLLPRSTSSTSSSESAGSATSTSSAGSTPCGSGSTRTGWPTSRSRPTR